MAKQPSKSGVKTYTNKYTGKMGSYTPLQPMNTQGDKMSEFGMRMPKRDVKKRKALRPIARPPVNPVPPRRP
jgi:hypothetical protein